MKKKYKIFLNNNHKLKKIFSTNIGYSIRKWFFNVKQKKKIIQISLKRNLPTVFPYIQYPHPDYLLYIRRFVFEKTINK